MQDKFNPYDRTTEADKQALNEAKVALDASYKADLANPYYSEHMLISRKTHRLWLAWCRLQLSQPTTPSSEE